LRLLSTDPLGNTPIFLWRVHLLNGLISAFEGWKGLILVSISVQMRIRGLKSLAPGWPH